VELSPIPPRRPLVWPLLIERLAKAAADPSALYLVGGAVRDALLGIATHDVDLATAGDGLSHARQLANALDGVYYPIDPERHTGRALIPDSDGVTVVDVASFRGNDLLTDLAGRDFTINAMAVPLSQPMLVIDPLGGQIDLFDAKLLRQCSPSSIASDPIRALRAVRLALQFRLRMEPATREAARSAASLLADAAGHLFQPERVRDELFKMLSGRQPLAAVRLLNALGLLRAIWPGTFPQPEALAAGMRVAERLADLITIISPRRDDNVAADLMLGVAVMVLDRHRRQLQDHLATEIGQGRPRAALLLLGALTPRDWWPAPPWAEHLRLSNAEKRVLSGLQETRRLSYLPVGWVDDRQAHRYYLTLGESGLDGVLLALAEYLAQEEPSPDPETWGNLLDRVASPLLDAYFRRHQQVVAPPPLITGDDLARSLGLAPGPQIGYLLDRLLEEQAAGTIRTKKEALRLAKRLLGSTDL